VIREGQVVLFRFPQTDQSGAKLRPALIIRKLPGVHDDWLICVISSQLSQAVADFDELVGREDADFPASGLRMASVIRVGRLAVVERSILVGSVGEISSERLSRIKAKLADWLRN